MSEGTLGPGRQRVEWPDHTGLCGPRKRFGCSPNTMGCLSREQDEEIVSLEDHFSSSV